MISSFYISIKTYSIGILFSTIDIILIRSDLVEKKTCCLLFT